jgi:hypothetical protein
MDQVHPLFEVHMLNKEGKEKAEKIAAAFSTLFRTLAGTGERVSPGCI